jgi:thiol:disulfide interchange protein DsbC
LSKKIKELDLSKAIKIGSGKVEVIEVTDPECPFCRRAEDMLSSVSGDITRYVFFMPLPFHKKAEPLACFILSSKDKEAIYRDVMVGKYDNSSNLKCDDKVKSLLSEHKEISMKMGIQGTPTFFVKTKSGEYIRVNGADPNLVNIIKDQLK